MCAYAVRRVFSLHTFLRRLRLDNTPILVVTMMDTLERRVQREKLHSGLSFAKISRFPPFWSFLLYHTKVQILSVGVAGYVRFDIVLNISVLLKDMSPTMLTIF